MPSANQAWNATELLEIISPATGTFCCVGWTTKSRRCRKPIARHNRWAAEAILTSIPSTSSDQQRLWTELGKLAGLALCRGYHQSQINQTAAKWHQIIMEVVAAADQEPNDSEGLDDEIRRLQRELEELRRRQEEQRRREDERHRGEERQREEARVQAEEEARQERERQEEEARRREEEETRRQEEQRREEARQQREEAQRQREARRRAEDRARVERERNQRARIAREWSESWARYERDWANMQRLDTSNLDEGIRDSVPWPVKSGRWQDVNEANVRTFLNHAPNGVVENPRRFQSLLRRQALRWHEDKFKHLFPRIAADTECMRLANEIMQVITGLMENRASL